MAEALEKQFQDAASALSALTTRPSDDDLLVAYGLYKQATVGNVNTSRPGIFDLKGRKKWDAWKSHENMSTEDAKKKYIAHVQHVVSSQ